jgi:hypothetical protein
MNGNQIRATITSVASTITFWCLWFAKLLGAIAVAYLAARLVRLGSINMAGTSIPFPILAGSAQDVVYTMGALWLVSR